MGKVCELGDVHKADPYLERKLSRAVWEGIEDLL